MSPAWRRLLVPLALSLLGHALLLYVIGLVPRGEEVVPSPHGADRTLTMSLCSIAGPVRRVPKPFEPKGDWRDVEPVMIPSTPPVGTIGVGVGPTLSARSDEPGSGSTSPRPSGSSVVVVPAEAQRVVFLLDRSCSMGLADALDHAKTELTSALNALPPETSFRVLVYNSTAWPLGKVSPGLLPSSRENIAVVRQQLDALLASGITRHLEAMKAAVLLQPDLIILLTDADDLSTDDVRLMTNANHGRAVIDIVELTRDPMPRPDGGLASLAALNGGRHRRVLLGRAEVRRLLAP